MNPTKTNKYRHKWQAFIGMALLSFGCYLDYTIVNVALPTIQQQLHANLLTLQWVMNIYFLALCVLATVMGRCGDIYGRRRLFYIGGVIFVIASIMAGLSSSMHELIIGRLLQGIGAAIVFPLGPSLLPQSFPDNERSRAIAWLGSLGGIALALGPVLGGLIVDYLGWRWIFFINIPLAIAGYLFCFSTVAESHMSEEQQNLDWLGMLLLALTICSIILGLIHSQDYGWENIFTLGYLFVGMIAGIALVKFENKIQNPIITFKDFKITMFFSGAVLIFLAGMLSAVALFFDPLYLQIIRGQSPTFSGLILFVIPIAVFGVAFIVDKIIRCFGLINTILIGLILGAFASLLQIFFTNNCSLYFVVIAFFILGSMWAIGNTVPVIAGQTAVGSERSSVATGTMITLFNLGGSVGLALSVVIYHSISLYALQSIIMTKQYISNVTQLALIKKLISNPADLLQTKIDSITHGIFNYAFMRGFSGVMCYLFIAAILLLLAVLVKIKFEPRAVKPK